MTAEPTGPIELDARRGRPGLADEIAADLRRRIFGGELAQGSRLDQDAIAAEHGASRIPVREALVALDNEGLVRTLPRRGTYVATFSREDVRDLYEVCGVVAGMAAARAAGRLGEAELAALRRANERFRAARTAADRRAANLDLHRLLNTAAGGSLRALLRVLDRGLPSHHYGLTRAWAAAAAAQHDRVIDAVAAGDGPAARAAMLEHFQAAGDEAVDALARAGFWRDGEDA